MDEACLRSGVVPAMIFCVNGYWSRISQHNLGRDVVGVNLTIGVCHLWSGRNRVHLLLKQQLEMSGGGRGREARSRSGRSRVR